MSDKWLLEHFLKNELFADQIIQHITFPDSSYYSSDITNDEHVSNNIKEILSTQGYTYFFDICFNHSDYSEIYTFATLKNPVFANNYILNNLDVLKIISDDLSVRCRRLLTKENTLILPSDFIIQMNELKEMQDHSAHLNLKEIIINKEQNVPKLAEVVKDNVFDFNNLPFSFLHSKEITHREKEIIYLYYQGFNQHRIAEILDLSKRTVDKHFERIKMKLNCDSIGHIIPALLRHDNLFKDLSKK
ncbi:LuxR C-terminal-related transcriptional regulator [uncultured Legionella sp.]|uniref:helix-turn-helix transcriptional regulator n=1 Tax=uncultured Legionella sp. TaxID=210934 RepID=UPI0026171FF3|nr:LuxR C-terminal-related transcriptional regulator [uncultured Legionella sp.]